MTGIAFSPGDGSLAAVFGPEGQVVVTPLRVDDDAIASALWRATGWCPSTRARLELLPSDASRAREELARCRARVVESRR